MRISKIVAATCMLAMLHGCAATGDYSGRGARTVETGEARGLKPWIKETPSMRLTYLPGGCDSAAMAPEPVTAFLLSTLFNAVRTELQRRATARADEYSATYAVRRNYGQPHNPSSASCIRVERLGPEGVNGGERPVRLTAEFMMEPVGGSAGQAMEIRPHRLLLTEPATRANGRDGARISNLTMTVALSGVVTGEKGPESRAFASQSFVFADLREGQTYTGDALGDASPVLVRLPAGAPMTIAVGVTEKGLGGQNYRDLASALENSKDAAQALIDAFYAAD